MQCLADDRVLEPTGLEIGDRVPPRAIVLLSMVSSSIDPRHLKPQPLLLATESGKRSHRDDLRGEVSDQLTVKAQLPDGISERIET